MGAVLDEYPYNASISFSFMVPMSNFFDLAFNNTNDWTYMADGTFIMLKDGENISSVMDSFEGYIERQHGSNPEWKVASIQAVNLYDLSKRSWEIVGSIAGGGHPAGRIAMIIIAVFLLGMACFNFMNIAVVGASKRLKEIALRKGDGKCKKGNRKTIHDRKLATVLFCINCRYTTSLFLASTMV